MTGLPTDPAVLRLAAVFGDAEHTTIADRWWATTMTDQIDDTLDDIDRRLAEVHQFPPFCSPALDGAVEGPTPPASIVAADSLCVPTRTVAGEQIGGTS